MAGSRYGMKRYGMGLYSYASYVDFGASLNIIFDLYGRLVHDKTFIGSLTCNVVVPAARTLRVRGFEGNLLINLSMSAHMLLVRPFAGALPINITWYALPEYFTEIRFAGVLNVVPQWYAYASGTFTSRAVWQLSIGWTGRISAGDFWQDQPQPGGDWNDTDPGGDIWKPVPSTAWN